MSGTTHPLYGDTRWHQDDCPPHLIADATGQTVAQVFSRSTPDGCGESCDVAAVARLIKAAPEIVQRAEDLMEWLESQPDLPGAIPHRVQKMRAALALLDEPQQVAA